jgi:hypothetical protein
MAVVPVDVLGDELRHGDRVVVGEEHDLGAARPPTRVAVADRPGTDPDEPSHRVGPPRRSRGRRAAKSGSLQSANDDQLERAGRAVWRS